MSSPAERFEVVVGAGSLRPEHGTSFAHRWTPEGVRAQTDFTGGHLLHLSVAGCVLNDLYREADALGVALAGARVRATGGFDTESRSSTGIEYEVELDSPAGPDRLAQLLHRVDEVAEIPQAVRAGATVRRS